MLAESILCSGKNYGGAGTLQWMAPETMDFDQPQCLKASDVFSLGVVYFEIWGRRIPFEGKNLNMSLLLEKLRSGVRETLPEDMPEALRKLISRMWATDPKDRPTMSEVERVVSALLGSCTRMSFHFRSLF